MRREFVLNHAHGHVNPDEEEGESIYDICTDPDLDYLEKAEMVLNSIEGTFDPEDVMPDQAPVFHHPASSPQKELVTNAAPGRVNIGAPGGLTEYEPVFNLPY